jgi:hypothetical protein
MPQPSAYDPSYAFIELVSWPGDKLDIELGNIEQTFDQILANLARIQRDDGKLANLSVHVDALSTEVRALLNTNWNLRGEWVTATSYAKLDFVSKDGGSYLCAVAHTSGTFSTDADNGLWTPIYVVPDTTIADGEITNAKLANVATQTFKGRTTAGTGAPEDLTAAQARTILNVADGANAYVHPNHTGDVTSTGDGATVIGNDKVTLAHMEHGTQGDVLIYGGSGAPTRLAAGTSGQYLESQGAGANPVWADLAAVTGFVPTGAMTDWLGTSTPPSGWVLADGRTIGDGSSGATNRANADTSTLFALLWGAFANTELAIQDSSGSASTRGASAAADYAAHKRLPVPDLRGRVSAGLDDMGGSAASRITSGTSGIAGTTVGAAGGDQRLHAHSHTITVDAVGSGSSASLSNVGQGVSAGLTANTAGAGASQNVQPTIMLRKIIKL